MKSLLRRLLLTQSVLLALAGAVAPAQAQTAHPMVRLHTTQGPIDMSLLSSEAPLTVNNFLLYVRGGDYTNVFFHRSIRNFVVQAGGFRWPETGITQVLSRGPVNNEFSATRSNVRGTVAMAKVGGDPNSATSQWFINMANNAANLDGQNGGFTVFARVTTPGMAVADRISALPIINASGGDPNGVFASLPVQNWVTGTTTVVRNHAVRITEVTEMAAGASTSDRIFNYLEAAFPEYLSPSKGQGGVWEGYTYRYYSGSNAYVGLKDGKVWYLVPSINANINELGTITDWLAQAQFSGY